MTRVEENCFKKVNSANILNKLLAILAIFMLLFITSTKKLNFCSAQSSENKKFTTIEEGVLTVGTNATFPPFEYVDENNKINGFDIKFIEKIAENLGYKLKICDMDFDALIPSLGKKTDLIIAGVTKTEEREKMVNFSKPYYESKQFVLTKKNKQIEHKNDLKNCIMAAQTGSTGHNLIKELNEEFKQSESKIKSSKDFITLVNELLNSRIDAIVLDKNTALTFQKIYPSKLKAIDGQSFDFKNEDYCIACSKQNQPLIDAINKQIDILIKSQTYANLVNQHINSNANQKLGSSSDDSNTKTYSLKDQFDAAFFKNNRWKLYLNGLIVSLEITFFAAMIGLFFGTILAMIRTIKLKKWFKVLQLLCKMFVDVIRGTPILVQLLIWWFVILQNSKNAIIVAIISFGLNSSAYVCEIVRGAIKAVDSGQTEAGLAMGFGPIQTLKNIVLPQGLKNAIPALCNEIISLLKETAIVGYIALVDLTRAADLVRAATYQAFVPLIIVAMIYFTITKTASFLLNLLERKLDAKW